MNSGTKTRWAVSAAGATVAVAAILLLFQGPARAPAVKVQAGAKARRTITLVPSRQDELAMRDLVPLYLPTTHNAVPGELRQLEPGRSFFDRDAERLKYSQGTPGLPLRSGYPVPTTPLEALRDTPGPLALGIGHVDDKIPAAAPSGAHVEIYGSDSRQSVLSLSLPPEARPGAGGRDPLGWRPLEFAAAVDTAGLVGPLLLTTSSGIEDVDAFFRNYLARSVRLGDRLPPGLYRIVVGP